MTVSLTKPSIGSTDWGGDVNDNFTTIEDSLNATLSNWNQLLASAFSTTAASTSTITMNSDETSLIKVGMAVKFKLSGSYYYARVKAITSSLLTIQGAPLTTGAGDLTELYVAERAFTMTLNLGGTWAGATGNTLLATVMHAYQYWFGQTVHAVHFGAVQKTADSGATQPTINVRLNGTSVGTENSGNGIVLAAAGTLQECGDVAISASNYAISNGQLIDLALTVVGTNKNSSDLSAFIVFVME